MVAEYKYLGTILGLMGSTILFIGGLQLVAYFRYNYSIYNIEFLFNINGITTTLIGAFGIFRSVLAIRDDARGYTYLLVAGAVGVVGTFIPICVYELRWIYPTHIHILYLISTYYYVDLILMVVGGVLGFALAEKKERKE